MQQSTPIRWPHSTSLIIPESSLLTTSNDLLTGQESLQSPVTSHQMTSTSASTDQDNEETSIEPV